MKNAVASLGRQLFDVYCDPIQALRLQALDETVSYIREHAPDAMGIRDREKLLRLGLARMPADGLVLEFGVDRGKSLRLLAEHVAPRKVFGFDSFRGNPEDWTGWNAPKGSFDRGGARPDVPENAELVVGYYDETLADWTAGNPGDVALIHVDCDLYSSTRTVFDCLGERLQDGSILVFDEYFNYTNWQAHEYKAFQEFVVASGCRYRYLAYGRQQVVVQIDSI